MRRWAIIKSNYVISVIIWDGITPYQYPFPYDTMVEDLLETAAVGDWYETSEDIFYRPLLKIPPDFPGNS